MFQLEGSFDERSVENYIQSWKVEDSVVTAVTSTFWDENIIPSDASSELIRLHAEAEKAVFRDITQSHKLICRQYAEILSNKITHLKSIYCA